MCLCDPPLGVIEEMIKENERSKTKCWRKTKCSSSKCMNKKCTKKGQCGKGGFCLRKKNHGRFCKKISRYDDFFDLIEETGPNMEMDIEEYDTDLDYGSTSYGVQYIKLDRFLLRREMIQRKLLI